MTRRSRYSPEVKERAVRMVFDQQAQHESQWSGDVYVSSCKRGAYALFSELLNGEIFYTLKEAKVVIERWRQEFNRLRPHSSLGYRPPAPETIWLNPAPLRRLQPALVSTSSVQAAFVLRRPRSATRPCPSLNA